MSNAQQVPASALARTAQILNLIIPANTTLPVNQAGEAFYVIACSCANGIEIRPRNGTFNSYFTGTGVAVDSLNDFDMVEVRNSTTSSVALSLWIGFGKYIDNRSILVGGQINPIVIPTYSVPGSLARVPLPDLSGTAIVDANGSVWFALNRVAIQITNLDKANAITIEALNGGNPVLACLPFTSLAEPVSGDFSAYQGGANMNGYVSEIYNAISPTF